jgi:uncharacterized integral membrane protein
MIMAGNIRLVLTLTLIGLIVVFSIQNVAEVEIQFLLWSFTTRRAFLIFAVLIIGILVGWIIHGIHHRSQRRGGKSVPDGASGHAPAAQRHDPTNED